MRKKRVKIIKYVKYFCTERYIKKVTYHNGQVKQSKMVRAI